MSVSNVYYDILLGLEDSGSLLPSNSNSIHLFCAHYVCLPRLQRDWILLQRHGMTIQSARNKIFPPISCGKWELHSMQSMFNQTLRYDSSELKKTFCFKTRLTHCRRTLVWWSLRLILRSQSMKWHISGQPLIQSQSPETLAKTSTYQCYVLCSSLLNSTLKLKVSTL